MASRLKLFNVLFLTFGALMLCIAAFTTASRLKLERVGITANGRVVRLDRRTGRNGGVGYYPVVQFVTRDDQEITFTGSIGHNATTFNVDDQVTVLYDPNDPDNASITTFTEFWEMPLGLFAMGVVFSGIPIGILLADARRRSRARWLKQFGRRISTKLDYVDYVTNVSVNGDHPYRILSRWTDPATNREYVFRSYDLWHDPKPLIEQRPGRSVDVLIDPNNPKRYWLDTDFLGDLAD